ncbi:uncharacterized protein LOC123534449 [Mercenaria mercenaria]|uniref:uncharacterized protein LOC123534449 n=1 Tax=Mercenaria mercenaria TaxID=6596 RepID=UPI00234FB028|nr:uncharacterized protein LOC123534449 [Mercenaria mercenaria]XP_053406551.1 uncharacterized protein LOC123534449 [Mercenaria mercenaria]
MWLEFLEHFNGTSFFINEKHLSSDSLCLYTDASGSKGFGAIYKRDWFFGAFPESWHKANITFLELYPIVIAVILWGHLWKNHTLVFNTDNEALVSVISKQTSKENNVMFLIRKLVLCCLKQNIIFLARHIRSKDDSLADALSRFQIDRFKELAPHCKQTPTTLDPSLQPEIFCKGLKSVNASLAPSTVETYKRGWKHFDTFCCSYLGEAMSLPVSVSILALLVAYLHQKRMSAKSILTYLSSISYVHKLSNMTDPTNHFLISTLIRGAQRLAPSYDLRLPITVCLLDKLISALSYTCESYYYKTLLSAMFLFAFNAFSRCSEITFSKPSTEQFIFQFADISFHDETTNDTSVTVTYRFFKHNYGKPHNLTFSHGHTKVSVIQALKNYIAIRICRACPLFFPTFRRTCSKENV